MATTTTVNDVYQNGHLAYQTDGSGTLLATFTYDDNGVPTSVQVGSNPQTAPRYYYVYNGHGDVVNLADANGNIVASYSYDEFGVPLSSSESFPGGWSNPYRYDGRDLVRFDSESSLYWMSVRAYDPTLDRFIARDPLGRTPLMGWTSQPYAYAGNNPLVNVDPSGQRQVNEEGAATETVSHRRTAYGRYYTYRAQHPYHGCIPDAPTSDTCKAWAKKANNLRDKAIKGLNEQGYRDEFLGGAIFIVTATVEYLAGKDAALKRLYLILNIATLVSSFVIPGLAGWIQTDHPEYHGLMQKAKWISSVLDGIIGAVNWAIGAYKTWGWLARRAIDLAMNLGQDALEGVPGVLESIAWQALGEGIEGLASGYANYLLSQMNASFAEANREHDASILVWCQSFANGACGPVPGQ